VRLRNSHGRKANREEVQMRITNLLRQLICLHLIILFIVSAGHLSAQTEEKLLDDINQLPEAERQTRLVNGAKKEGTVTWYVAMNRAYAQDLINSIEAQYPRIGVRCAMASTTERVI
jgi:vancomycin permeability regulator SanA